jgi:hypothetical protein
MARRLAVPSKELQLLIIGPRDSFPASRVQRLSLTANQPSETKDELGNPNHVGEVKDIPDVTLTFSAFDVSIKIFAALTGTSLTAYPAGGVDIANLGEIDAAIYVKDPDVADYVKSIHARKLQIRDFTFNYSVDGDSTEDYTAIGSERRYLKYDVVVDKFSTGTTSFTLSQTPVQLLNGNNALSVILDGDYLTEVTGAPATGEYRLVSKTLTTGDTRTAQVLVVYHSNPSGENWTDIGDATIPVAIRGMDANVTIMAEDISRVQSITINGNMNTKAVKELGTRDVVGYQSQVPTIEGTITVLDTDLDLISLLTDGEVTASGVVEWSPAEGCTVSGVSLTIELSDPCDTSSPFTVLKTVYLPSITIVGDSYTANVNDNASQVFNWKSADAQCIIYSGAKP